MTLSMNYKVVLIVENNSMDLQKAEQLARELLKEHGLDDWSFVWKRGIHKIGVCRYSSKRIELSKDLTAVNEEYHIIDTVKHEIAHALVGKGFGHGSTWRIKAIEIGCTPSSTADKSLIIPWKYLGTCPQCKDVWHRMRIIKGSRCPKCLKDIKWKLNK